MNTEQIDIQTIATTNNNNNDIKKDTNNINNNNNKRKFIDQSNNNKTNKSNNNNRKGNNHNNNNNNKKQKLKYTHDYNYKLISPFQKYLDFGICPTLIELYTEFYHILNENKQECKCNKLKLELDELKKMNSGKEPIPPNFEFSVHHQHTKEEIDSIKFDPVDRESIELTVRKFCGFLSKESNMVLMEMIILSIGLVKSIEFLHLTLEIERDGGIFTTAQPRDNKTTATTTTTTSNDTKMVVEEDEEGAVVITSKAPPVAPSIPRRRTPGGVFYKLVNLHIPNGFKTNLFSISSLFKYKNERKKKGFGTLVNLRDKLLNFTNEGNQNSGNNNNNNNNSDKNNSNNLNRLLNEVDEEFDKLCISPKGDNNQQQDPITT